MTDIRLILKQFSYQEGYAAMQARLSQKTKR
jgi:hypothetical protein